jgi:hypothetical protein
MDNTNPTQPNKHIEAIVVMTSSGDKDAVEKWFLKRSFACIPMRAGFLVQGDDAAFERAFSTRVGLPLKDIKLPVPTELSPHVVSIEIPRLPSYGSKP